MLKFNSKTTKLVNMYKSVCYSILSFIFANRSLEQFKMITANTYHHKKNVRFKNFRTFQNGSVIPVANDGPA